MQTVSHSKKSYQIGRESTLLYNWFPIDRQKIFISNTFLTRVFHRGEKSMTIGIFFIRSVFCLTFLIFQTLFLGNSLVATASDTALNDRSIVTFTTTSLDNRFFTEGASVAVLDLDGDIDLIAGPFWFEGPLFTQRHTFYETTPFDPQGYSNNFFSFTHDMNNDGFPDILVYGFPGKDASWFENPGKKEELWKRYFHSDKPRP